MVAGSVDEFALWSVECGGEEDCVAEGGEEGLEGFVGGCYLEVRKDACLMYGLA